MREHTLQKSLDPHLNPLPNQGEEVGKRQVRIGDQLHE